MGDLMETSMARRRLSTWLLGIFSALALLLATVGIYGIVSYAVAQRSHEVGIRMALGASRAQVLHGVLGQSLWMIMLGIAAGLAGAFALTRLLSSLLFGVTATDPVAFLAAAGAMLTAGIAASLIPAHRATNVDPASALRQE
jgi:ABC-type antimicrobial peptide transport system permease subunit